MTSKLDTFTQAYIEAALWASTLDPFGECPQCGKLDQVLCRWNDSRECVCAECSDTQPDYEPPADDNYTPADIALEALTKMTADCERFQRENAGDITSENLVYRSSYDINERAGHDFWLTRSHHGAGFWNGDWREPAATKLTTAAHAYGECELYVGDDGRIYC